MPTRKAPGAPPQAGPPRNIGPGRFMAGAAAGSILILSSCSSLPPSVQPQVNGLVVANRLDRALHVLENQPQAYGAQNELLYILDRGMVLHLAGRYKESIAAFEQAKRKIDQLYTQSISKLAGSWVVNDYTVPYRGEDYEHVLVNVFQALNFAALGEYEEALVEARDVDAKLYLINRQYPEGQKNVYREDAFVRFLMGILYELTGDARDLNDADVSYRQALQIYERDYGPNYQVAVPLILKENLLSVSQRFDPAAFRQYRGRFPDAHFFSLEDKQKNAEVYLVQYNGLGPLKIQNTFPVVLPDGYAVKLAFPRFSERVVETASSRLLAQSDNGPGVSAPSELGEDIQAIAQKNLDNRRLRIYAKAALRPAAKYFLEKSQEGRVRDQWGETGTYVYRGLAGIYNVYSEQADLRTWQTLPAQIRLSRLILKPGDYALRVETVDASGRSVETIDLGRAALQAGQKRFYLIRTAR